MLKVFIKNTHLLHKKTLRLFGLFLVYLFGAIVVNQFEMGTVQATLSTNIIMNIETVSFSDSAIFLLAVNDGQKMLIGTNTSKVYLYDGQTFTKIFDLSSVGNKDVKGLYQDQRGNIYISPQHNGTVWRSLDGGLTWTKPLNMVNHGGEKGTLVPKSAWCSLENGTILAGQWTGNGPYVYKSDNWGETWSLWLNFSAIFPEYMKYDPENPSWFFLRHIHSVAYLPAENALFVAVGDVVHALYKSADGGNTWTMVYPHGVTSHVNFGNKIIWATDGWIPMIAYENQQIRPVLLPRINSFSTVNLFKSFAYDEDYGVLYVGVGTEAIVEYTAYTSLLASTDQGETWTLLRRLEATPSNGKETPDIAVLGNYVYYAWQGELKRFNRLSKAEVSYIHNQDYISKIIYYQTHMSFTTKILKNPQLTINSFAIENKLSNPSFEKWETTPKEWSEPFGNWNGTRTYQKGIGYHGNNSYELIIGGGGSTYVTQGPIYLTKGQYTFSGYLKTNASYYPRQSFGIYTYPDMGRSVQRLYPYYENTWRRLEFTFYLSADAPVIFYFSTSPSIRVNLTINLDAFALYKHPTVEELTNIQYTETSMNTLDGTLIFGGHTISFTLSELPKTVSLGEYIVGYVPVRLQTGNIVNITISGEEVLSVNNAIIEQKGNGKVYIGKIYNNFSITKNVENALICFYQFPANITSASFSTECLSLTISAPSGAASLTKIYTADKGKPTHIWDSFYTAVTTSHYNDTSKILTLTTTHSGQLTLSWEDFGIYVLFLLVLSLTIVFLIRPQKKTKPT